MIAEIAPWVIALIVILTGGGIGWAQIKRHGKTEKERDAWKDEAQNLRKIIRKHVSPLESDADFERTLERMLDGHD